MLDGAQGNRGFGTVGQDFNYQNDIAQKQKLMMGGRPSTNKLNELPPGGM